ncbi:MAG TPA: hopanoid-associated sugar epimerase [Methylocystis sp.]|nr:hopanoid-associated sugar epimerase [Methylocystis sp.]
MQTEGGSGPSGDLALVVGASGFIGGAVARALQEAGFRVRAFLRPTSPRWHIHPEFEVAIGDVTDRESVARAMCGVRYVFNIAAEYRLWTPDPARLLRNNVEGARNVMEESLRAGVERVVHTSSVTTLAPDWSGPCDETRRQALREDLGAYKRSKILSERLVCDMVERERLPATIVLPTAPLGSGDLRPTPTGRIVLETLRGHVPAFVDTGLDIAHVDDVARGHVLALRHGAIGGRYILGGENLDLRTMLRDICQLSGRRPPLLRLPRAPLAPVAAVNEFLARFSGREPFLNRESLRLAATPMFFDDSRARRELRYTSRPAAAAFVDAIRWFEEFDRRRAEGAA